MRLAASCWRDVEEADEEKTGKDALFNIKLSPVYMHKAWPLLSRAKQPSMWPRNLDLEGSHRSFAQQESCLAARHSVYWVTLGFVQWKPKGNFYRQRCNSILEIKKQEETWGEWGCEGGTHTLPVRVCSKTAFAEGILARGSKMYMYFHLFNWEWDNSQGVSYKKVSTRKQTLIYTSTELLDKRSEVTPLSVVIKKNE